MSVSDFIAQIPHDKLMICHHLSIYEYYDGIHLEIDDVKLLLAIDNELIHNEVIDFLADNLSPNLEEFFYTSRFYQEVNYRYFKVAPLSLKKFYFSSCKGINKEFIANATHLTFNNFHVEGEVTMPNGLQYLSIDNLEYDDDDILEEFLQELGQLPSFIKLTGCDNKELLEAYLPGKYECQ